MGIRDFEDIDILEIVDERHMTFLESKTAREAIETLVDLFVKTKCIANREQVIEAVLHREKIVSTGIGLGIALPHARIEGIDDFYVAIGIQKESWVNWASLDNIPVRIVILVVGPQDQDTLYLKVLSKLTEIVRTPETRSQLLHVQEISDLVYLFQICYTAG